MIYQSNNEFKVFSFQADFSGKKEYLTDKTEFEKMLLEQLQMQENMLAMQEEREPVTVSLPAITYTNVVLTTEQSARFAEVKDLGLTLDEVRDYTVEGTVPTSDPYKVVTLQKQLTQVQTENVDLMTMLVEGGIL